MLPLSASWLAATGLQLGDAAGRASTAWAERHADFKQDSSSLFLGGRIGGGLGVYQLLFIHHLKDNHAYLEIITTYIHI